MTKRELDREISEYEDGELTRTNARDLASLYIVRKHLYPDTLSEAFGVPESGISRDGATLEERVGEYGETAFFKTIAGKPAPEAWRIVGELMDVLQMVNIRAYNGVMRKLSEI